MLARIAGALLGDGLGDGILVEPTADADFDVAFLRDTSFALLQGSRMRNTKTEFVRCFQGQLLGSTPSLSASKASNLSENLRHPLPVPSVFEANALFR